jgi:hypothetical protein
MKEFFLEIKLKKFCSCRFKPAHHVYILTIGLILQYTQYCNKMSNLFTWFCLIAGMAWWQRFFFRSVKGTVQRDGSG